MEAFKYSNIKDSITKNDNEKLNESPEEKKRINEDSQTKIDVDDVFGFDDWEQNDEEINSKIQEEEKQPEFEAKTLFEQEEKNSDLDLFEYNLEEIPEAHQETPHEMMQENNEIKEEEIEKTRAESSVKNDSQKQTIINEKNEISIDQGLCSLTEEKNEDILRKENSETIQDKESPFYEFKENKVFELKDLYKVSKIAEDEEPEVGKSRKLKVTLKPKTIKEDQNGFVVKVLANENRSIPESKPSNITNVDSQTKLSPTISEISYLKSLSPKTLKKDSRFNIYEYVVPENQSIRETYLEEASSGVKVKDDNNREESNQKLSPKTNIIKPKSEKKEVSWFHRLINEAPSQAIRMIPSSKTSQASQTKQETIKKEIQSQEITTEIIMEKNSQENIQEDDINSQKLPHNVGLEKRTEVLNTQEIGKSMSNLFGDLDFNDLDEEKLVNEMKGLDDPDNVDKVNDLLNIKFELSSGH